MHNTPVSQPSENSGSPKNLEPRQEGISSDSLQHLLRALKNLGDNPAYLSRLSIEERIELMKAADRIARPSGEDKKKLNRANRRRERLKQKKHDREVRKSTKIRETRQQSVFFEPKRIESSDHPETPDLKQPRNCYVCKVLFTRVHFFYDAMCRACGDLNYQKRFQTADLKGRTALVTGGRVKIGYQTALKLLRAGARTLVSTRFPNDAALRFSREEDFSVWKDRLQIFGLDLRHSPSVEIFARYVSQTEERLDILVNNAAQTVRKPPGFYRHLMEIEGKRLEEMPEAARSILSSYDECKRALETNLLPIDEENLENTLLKAWPGKSPAIGIRAAAKLSMIPYEMGDDSSEAAEVFPEGRLDADLQQVDLRTVNSWRLALADVATSEMLEVHLVNAVAPFILSAKLKGLMCRVPSNDKHIVQASAMEGKFSRFTKTDKHPHTNMAKAALNMLARTSAADYVKSGIHMNAVDTGWITDEDPAHLSGAKKDMHDFEPPLDIVDGAARLLDPVFTGHLTGRHVWGCFLKDYAPTEW